MEAELPVAFMMNNPALADRISLSPSDLKKATAPYM